MTSERLKRIPELTVLAACAVAGGLFFTLTDPKTIAPGIFIIAFVILAVALNAVLRLVGRLSGLRTRLKKVRYNGLLVGGTVLPVMLLALQSIGQLTVRDTLTLIVLFVAGYFYLSRLYGSR